MAEPVIIYRLGSLGDTVVALPCFHRIAQAFPNNRRLVLTNAPVSDKAAPLDAILGPSGLIDGVIDYPVGTRSPAVLLDLRKRISAIGATTLVYLSAPRGKASVIRDALFFRSCGLRRLIGTPWTANALHRIDPASDEREPEAERMARGMQALGSIDLADRANWNLRLTATELAAGAAAIAPLGDQPFFAINIGGKAAHNDWGDDNWAALLDGLAPQLGSLGLVAVGGAFDRDRSDALLARWPQRSVNLCGAMMPRESAAVLARAQFFIGHDSGPMHLAAAMGTRAVGLFGDANPPRIWHPYGPGHVPIHDLRGVRAIEVARVRDAALALGGAGR